ncbi:MAG: hypothetical protein H7Y60_14945 [Rhodospirillaceae bacterium]|nr:hypothetical protein [Rhodospirillales bacterium]
MRVAPPLFLLLAGLVSACAVEPFVDLGTAVTVQKTAPASTLGGIIYICHSDDTPWNQVTTLAEEQCGTHGLKPLLMETQRWQCRATSPNRTRFSCVDPNMRNADGSYVSPFDRTAVAAWEKRTGKKAPAYGATRGPVVSPPEPTTVPPESVPGPAAPPPAPISAVQPLTPADIAGKPAIPVQQPFQTQAPPLPAPAPLAPSSFTLEPGSWGHHFEQ